MIAPIVLGVQLGILTALLLINMRLLRLARKMRLALLGEQMTQEQLTRAVYALTVRINPNGHVDLSQEEWEVEEKVSLKVEVTPWEGGARILVR